MDLEIDTVHSAVNSDCDEVAATNKRPFPVRWESKIDSRASTPSSPSSRSRRSSPSFDLTDDQKSKLDRLTNRKSFRVPMSMKNILNTNGHSEREDLIMKACQLELSAPDNTVGSVSETLEPTTAKKAMFKPPRDIILTNRPTEPQRAGYLSRFDASNKDHGEDAWITQYVMLDIPSAEFQLFSEVMG
jgi:hypothetical protein